MIKRLIGIFGLTAIFCLSAAAQSTTTITGTIRDGAGNLVTSGQVAFTLQPGIDSTMSGVARFSPQEIDCTITGAGLIKALDGVSSCTLVQNLSIQPSGTSWKGCVQPQFIQPGSCLVFYAFGTTLDLTAQIPTPPLTPSYNLVDTFSNQTIGGNKTFSGTLTTSGGFTFGTFTASGAANLGDGGSLSGTFSGNPTFSGNVEVGTINTVSGPNVFGGAIDVPSGAASTPSVSFAGDTNTGIFDLSPDNFAIATAGVGRAQFNSSGEFIPSGACFDWNSGALGSTQDTGICRDSAGAIDFGNGSPGDKSAILNAAGINLTQFFSTAGIESTKVIRDCRKDGLVGTGLVDDAPAMNACLANAYANNENVQLPCSNIRVDTSINDTNKPSLIIYGCGSSNPGITAGTGEGNTNVTTILCNTGNHPCVDGLGSAHSGLWHVNLLSRNSFSTPSNIARMIGRDSALDPNGGHAFCFSEFMYDFDVYVLMESSPTANNNLGRIGYYDVGGAEIFRIASSDLTADRPAYLSTTNATVGASSLYQTIIGTCATSMEGWESNMVAYTPVSATRGGAITLEGPTNGLHNLFSGDCIMNAGAASGDYCLQIGADGSYGIKMFPAFTVEQIQGAGGVAFFNGTCTGCTFDASTSSPSGMTNAWYQFSGAITTRGNSTAGIGAIDSTFAAHRVNPGDTPAPLLKCSGCGSPLVTLKGGTFTLGSTTVPFSDTNTIISGSTVIASGFTDSQVTFGAASKYILLDDSGTSIIGGINGTLAYKRQGATLGTTVVAGDFALSAGWGTTASKAFQGGSDSDGFLGVTSSGTGQAANPTITFTFHDGAWGANAPNCLVMRADFNTAPTNVIFGESASSATQITWGFNGTPVAGNTYSLKWKCGSRN